MSRYLSVNDHLREKYGRKIYKLALTGGKTCPNRDGKCGYGGCTFCGEGSGSFASESIDDAINKLQYKNTGDKYIAYFQSFTSTYKMDEEIRRRIREAAEDDRIEIVSIATRPDCLQREVMDFLEEIRSVKPLWIELGLQTINEKTAADINRGYELKVFEDAVVKLREIDAEIIVHLILGLPGESRVQMLKSIEYLNKKDIQGVKLQLLHILKGTKLAAELSLPQDIRDSYPFTLEEYADLLAECIHHLRKDIVVHRITGDAAKKDLIAPYWSADKKRVLNTINKVFEDKDVVQGAYYGK